MGRLRKFVFVVCGGKEHIETLHFSLVALKKYSQLPIIVITDSLRNEISIEHEAIIDIKTPLYFNNHQASIYLKTGIHKFLSFANNEQYCYLDTDVVALNSTIDSIFDFFHTPVIFSTDHCKMDFFSPYAVRCNCINESKAEELDNLIAIFEQRYNYLFETKQGKEIQSWLNIIRQINYDISRSRDFFPDKKYETTVNFFKTIKAWKEKYYQSDDVQKKRELLYKLTSTECNNFLKLCYNYFFIVPKFFNRNFIRKIWYDKEGNIIYSKESDFFLYLNKHKFYINKTKDNTAKWYHEETGLVQHQELYDFDSFLLKKGIRLNEKNGCYINDNEEILYPNIPMLVQNNSNFKFDFNTGEWFDKSGKKVFELQCNHLKEAIRNKFNIEIGNANWQHWNGGVFLFDKSSLDFLNTWHNYTMEVFKDPYWKTRDQGTLIATVWKFKLESHPTLPIEFNFLADYNHPTMQYCGDFEFNLHECEKNIVPNFIHIYHNWGDENWKVWRDVKNRIFEHYD